MTRQCADVEHQLFGGQREQGVGAEIARCGRAENYRDE